MHLFVAPDYYISDFYFTRLTAFTRSPVTFALSMSAVAPTHLAVSIEVFDEDHSR